MKANLKVVSLLLTSMIHAIISFTWKRFAAGFVRNVTRKLLLEHTCFLFTANAKCSLSTCFIIFLTIHTLGNYILVT